jgi:hypothetical protein
LPEDTTEEGLTRQLFGGGPENSAQEQPLLDSGYISIRGRCDGITLQLFSENTAIFRYISYNRFCEFY